MSSPGSPLVPSTGDPDTDPKDLLQGLQDDGNQKVPVSKIISWMSWDWASAAVNAVATTFVFAVYITTDGLFADAGTANQALSVGMAVSGVIIAFLAPITGQRADRSGKGPRILGWFSLAVFLTLGAMFFVAPDMAIGPMGALWLGVALLGFLNIFSEFAVVNYNAMLNDISTPQNRGRISGLGWGSAYVGGIVLLMFLLVAFIQPEVGLFGVTSDNGLNIRVSMIFAALWFGIFALPVIINPPKKVKIETDLPRETLVDSYRHLFRTIKSLWNESRDTLKFLLASAIFRDGLAGVFTFGGVIAGSVFGFTAGEVVVFAVVANVVAAIATWLFGPINDKFGSKPVIIVSLVLMIIAGTAVFFLYEGGTKIFWIFGLILTLFVGPVQSASRTFLANIIPKGREGEVFGLYATAGRAVSFLAPMMYGLAISIGALFMPEGSNAAHWGILGIAVVLLIGLLLMIPVRSDRAHITDV